MVPSQSLARRAGLLYLLACAPAPFAMIYVPGMLFAGGDAAAIAGRLRGAESMVRWGLAAELFSATLLIFAGLAFYRLLESVGRRQAVLMVALLFISVPISYFNALNVVAALSLVGGAPWLGAMDPRQLDTLAVLFLRLHGQGFVIAQIFWGLWLFPYGWLVVRSGFIPRALGLLLMVAGAGYLVSSAATLFLPGWGHVIPRLAMALGAGELPILVWLLVWGVKAQPARASAIAPGLGAATGG